MYQLIQAISCCEQAIKIDPKLASAWMNKGAAQLSLERVQEALASFEEAHRLGHPRAIRGIESCREALDE